MKIKYTKTLFITLTILFALGAGFFIYSNYSKEGLENATTTSLKKRTKRQKASIKKIVNNSNSELKKGSNKIKNWFNKTFRL